MNAETAKAEAAPKPTTNWAAHWQKEFDAAKKRLEAWHKQAEGVLKRYLDEREATQSGDTRWTFFTSNVQTRLAMMYGQTPRASVNRRFADAQDDDARVAGSIMERKLNCDIEADGDGFADALWLALLDYELPGLGFIKWRYVAETEQVAEQAAIQDEATGAVLAEAVPAHERKTYEAAESDYVHWRDALWSPARTFREWRWCAFRAQMTREELVKRFGAKGQAIPLNSKKRGADAMDVDATKDDPWDRADVWEIHDKERRKVFWFVDGHSVILDEKDDPLKLRDFWPFGRPMAANLTTSAYVPRPNYVLTQDLYNEIDTVSTRITVLERAIAVRGVYDSAQPALKSVLTDAAKNELIPADNFAALAEKGGLSGVIDWMPLDQVVNALTALRDYRKELIDALHQLTGMSDIMRGQATQAATATEQRIKANFGSVRMQALQSEFARFASDSLKVKAEIIAKHFDPETIIRESNIERTPDAKFAQAAVQLLKTDFPSYRIEVKPEAVSLQDFASEKQKAVEFMGALATGLQALTPIMEKAPAATPTALKMLGAAIAKFPGAQDFETLFDEAVEAAEQAAAAPQPAQQNPKLAEITAKSQSDMAKEDQKLKNDMVRTQMDVVAETEKQAAQAKFNIEEHRAKTAIKPPAQVKPTGVAR